MYKLIPIWDKTYIFVMSWTVATSDMFSDRHNFAPHSAHSRYDVWLGNVRGNTYGKRHVKLTPSDSKFWEFTFDEMLSRDVPAMIDYVLEKTGT